MKKDMLKKRLTSLMAAALCLSVSTNGVFANQVYFRFQPAKSFDRINSDLNTSNPSNNGAFSLSYSPASVIYYMNEDTSGNLIVTGASGNASPQLSGVFQNPVTYSLGGVPSGLTNVSVNPSTGAFSALPSSFGSWNVNVTASDASAQAASPASINVQAVWDSSTPSIAEIAGSSIVFNEGVESSWVPSVKNAQNGSGWSYGGTTYSINKALPAGLGFNTSTGAISGTPTVSGAFDGYQIAVASANGKSSQSAPFSIHVNSAQVLAFADPGSAFSLELSKASVISLQTNNASGAVTYETVSGTPGLTVSYDNTNSAMSVSAALAGTYSLTVKATDSSNKTASKTFSFTASHMAISVSADTWTLGTTTSLAGPSVTGSTGNVSFAFTGLPTGLVANPQTGVVTANADPAPGIYSVTATVIQTSNNVQTTTSYSLKVVPAAALQFVSNDTSATIYTGGSHTFDVSVINGVGPVTVSVYYASDTSIASYTYDAVAHTVTVTGVSPGLAFFRVSAIDSIGRKDTFDYVLWATVKSSDTPLIADVNENSLTATSGATLSFTPTVTDQQTSNPWSEAGTVFTLNKSLPTGFSFDTTTGRISGISTTLGVYPDYTISVKSSYGSQTTTSPFKISVVPAQAMSFTDTTGSLNAHTSQTKTLSLAVSNAVGNVSYATVSATSGLVVSYDNTAQQMTVSSDTAGNYLLTVSATDAAGRNATKSFNISVTTFAVVAGNKSWTIGNTTSLPAPTLQGLQGTAIYAYAGLPTGLIYDSATGAITASGTPISGSYPVTVNVSDSYDNATASANFNLFVVPGSAIDFASYADRSGTTYVGDSYAFDLSLINQVGTYSYNVYYVSTSGIVNYVTSSANHNLTVTGLTTGQVSLYVSATDQAGRTTGTKVLMATVKTKDTPQIADIGGNGLSFTVGTLGSFTPSVTDSQTSAAWSETGTVFSLNQALPSGLILDAGTGKISGTTSVTGVYAGYQMTVKSSYGQTTTTAPFSIYSIPSQAIAFTGSTTTYTVHTGVGMAIPLAMSNAVGQVTYSTVSVTSGLNVTYDNVNQQMTVTGTAVGTYTLKVQATDAAGRTITKTFTITDATLSVTMGAQAFTIGTSSTSTLPSVSNALGTVSYSYANLPAGLTGSSSTGQISGSTTAASGNYTATLTITDAGDNSTATTTFNVAISSNSVSGQRCWKLTYTVDSTKSDYNKLFEFDLIDKNLGNIWATSKYAAYNTTELARTYGAWSGRSFMSTDNNVTTSFNFDSAKAMYFQIDFGTDPTMYPDVSSVKLVIGAHLSGTNTSTALTNVKVWSATSCNSDGTSTSGWTARFADPSAFSFTTSNTYNTTLALP